MVGDESDEKIDDRGSAGDRDRMWGHALEAIQGARYAEYGSSPLASALASWSQSTITNYTCHMRALAGSGEEVDAYLTCLGMEGRSPSWMRQAASAVRMAEDLGLCEARPMAFLWRICRGRAKVDGTGAFRPYGGPGHFEFMSKSCREPRDWAIIGAATISFVHGLRVGELASIRVRDLHDHGFSFLESKRQGPPVKVWRGWSGWSAPWGAWLRAWAECCGHEERCGLLFPIGSPYLQEGMRRLLVGSEWEDHRWHAWRRAGAWQLHMLGLPIRWLHWWGRWKSEQIARSYAAPGEDIEPADS